MQVQQILTQSKFQSHSLTLFVKTGRGSVTGCGEEFCEQVSISSDKLLPVTDMTFKDAYQKIGQSQKPFILEKQRERVIT